MLVVGIGAMLPIPNAGLERARATAQGKPSGNGDVNGSGAIDIADAIYLLSYLFSSGPLPEEILCPECPPCDSIPLPATGQTRCYDPLGNLVDCASLAYPGQDGFYQLGCPMEGRFVNMGDGTVTDRCTGLMWQKETAPGMYTWQAALKYCEKLALAGHTDWRLPNIREASEHHGLRTLWACPGPGLWSGV